MSDPTNIELRPFGQEPIGTADSVSDATSIARSYVFGQQPDLDAPWVELRHGGRTVGWIDGDGDYHEGPRRVWVVIDSTPGHLPDGDPVQFYEAEWARKHVIDELRRLADHDVPEREAEALTFLAEEVNLTGDAGVFTYTYAGRERVIEYREVTA